MHHLESALFQRKLVKPLWKLPFSRRLTNRLRLKYIDSNLTAPIDDYDGNLKITLRLSEHMQSQIFWNGYYSKSTCLLIKRFIKKGMIAVDGGANIGEISLVLSKCVGLDGKIYAFEPVKSIKSELYKNIKLNNLYNIEVVGLGISDRKGTSDIFISSHKFEDGSNHGGLGTLYKSRSRFSEAEKIELTTLDIFAEERSLTRLDLIKLDIEGAELAALRGAEQTLRRFNPYIIIEVQEETARSAGYEARDVLEFLDSLNYRFDVIGGGGRTRPINAGHLKKFQNILCSPKK